MFSSTTHLAIFLCKYSKQSIFHLSLVNNICYRLSSFFCPIENIFFFTLATQTGLIFSCSQAMNKVWGCVAFGVFRAGRSFFTYNISKKRKRKGQSYFCERTFWKWIRTKLKLWIMGHPWLHVTIKPEFHQTRKNGFFGWKIYPLILIFWWRPTFFYGLDKKSSTTFLLSSSVNLRLS